MPKLKTRKSIASRIKVTQSRKNKKYLRRQTGQSHFNARDTGDETRNKRGYVSIAKADEDAIDQALPYAK